VLLPGSADCLIAMEMSEILRPGFLDMLKTGGTMLLARTTIVPHNLPAGAYPSAAAIKELAGGYEVLEVDVLAKALAIGDTTGRIANVVMLGALSQVAPFDAIPGMLWLKALQEVSPNAALWAANYSAFEEGRTLLA
jgi:indolepyruvate ferredoxin oxidoreductase, alpha subunit